MKANVLGVDQATVPLVYAVLNVATVVAGLPSGLLADRIGKDKVLIGAFGLFAFSGMADHDQARVDLCARYAAHYGEDWWFLTNYGWAMTENGEAAKGRAMTERAFALRRDNAH